VAEENKLLYAGVSSMPNSKMPIASAEDVEFADELADEDDQEAQQRAIEADRRVTGGEGV
jgi:hypothetical protein